MSVQTYAYAEAHAIEPIVPLEKQAFFPVGQWSVKNTHTGDASAGNSRLSNQLNPGANSREEFYVLTDWFVSTQTGTFGSVSLVLIADNFTDFFGIGNVGIWGGKAEINGLVYQCENKSQRRPIVLGQIYPGTSGQLDAYFQTNTNNCVYSCLLKGLIYGRKPTVYTVPIV